MGGTICKLFYCRDLKGREVYLMKADAWDLLNMPVDEAINLFDKLYDFLNNLRKYVSCTATKIPFMYSFSGNCAASIPISDIYVSVSNLYISKIVPHISCSRIGRSIGGIYKSLTDTCMWKLGL